ncbi:MAG: lysoplasmalogenase [Clostridiales bacterium]|nr:lysoplasmalogenase [Clostridiales bacterium]
MVHILLYIALTWLVLMPSRFRAMEKGYRKTSLALKALPTALAAAFAAAGYLGTDVRDLYGLMIFIGLCVCTLADIALDIKFEIGGALFFAGHVIYVTALSQYRVLSWWCLTVFAIALVGLWFFALRYRRYFPKPHLLAGVLVYVVALAALLAFSLPLPLLAPSARSTLAALGAVTFVISDMTLCHNTLLNRPAPYHFVSLGIYYMAQLLLALSAFPPA